MRQKNWLDNLKPYTDPCVEYSFRPYRYNLIVSIIGGLSVILLVCDCFIWIENNTCKNIISVLVVCMLGSLITFISIFEYYFKVYLSLDGISITHSFIGMCYQSAWNEYSELYFTTDWHGHQHLILSHKKISPKVRRKLANKNGFGLFYYTERRVVIPVVPKDVLEVEKILGNKVLIIYQ